MTSLLVPVVPSPTVRAWLKHSAGGRARYMDLGDALVESYTTDAHFGAYSAPSIERRLCLAAITDPTARIALPGGVTMIAAIFDIDAESAHRAAGGDGSPASDEWWTSELEKIETLGMIHPRPFGYRTRGGYLLVSRLDPPIVLASERDSAFR